jgi:ubiquinone/menaquinone biosynthesis C-methylase UbiE
MGFYRDQILPWLINRSMRQKHLADYRSRVVAAAEGRVLEIGIGSGLNLPFYSSNVRQVIGLEPSSTLLAMADRAGRAGSRRLKLIRGSAETIPLEDACAETVVTTWTLCSIADVRKALREMRRVMKPGGRLLFLEHGLAPEANIRWWQDRLTPMMKRIGGGCHLNRAIDSVIEGAGFEFDRLATGYMRGPKPMTFMYEGSARPR